MLRNVRVGMPGIGAAQSPDGMRSIRYAVTRLFVRQATSSASCLSGEGCTRLPPGEGDDRDWTRVTGSSALPLPSARRVGGARAPEICEILHQASSVPHMAEIHEHPVSQETTDFGDGAWLTFVHRIPG